jgi:hypothetical protein
MLDAGVDIIQREYLDSALRMAADALSMMGFRRYPVTRALQTFRKHDELFLRELAELHHEEHKFIQGVKEKNADLERMMLDDMDDMDGIGKDKDQGWDNTSMKKEFSPLLLDSKNKDKKTAN